MPPPLTVVVLVAAAAAAAAAAKAVPSSSSTSSPRQSYSSSPLRSSMSLPPPLIATQSPCITTTNSPSSRVGEDEGRRGRGGEGGGKREERREERREEKEKKEKRPSVEKGGKMMSLLMQVAEENRRSQPGFREDDDLVEQDPLVILRGSSFLDPRDERRATKEDGMSSQQTSHMNGGVSTSKLNIWTNNGKNNDKGRSSNVTASATNTLTPPVSRTPSATASNPLTIANASAVTNNSHANFLSQSHAINYNGNYSINNNNALEGRASHALPMTNSTTMISNSNPSSVRSSQVVQRLSLAEVLVEATGKSIQKDLEGKNGSALAHSMSTSGAGLRGSYTLSAINSAASTSEFFKTSNPPTQHHYTTSMSNFPMSASQLPPPPLPTSNSSLSLSNRIEIEARLKFPIEIPGISSGNSSAWQSASNSPPLSARGELGLRDPINNMLNSSVNNYSIINKDSYDPNFTSKILTNTTIASTINYAADFGGTAQNNYIQSMSASSIPLNSGKVVEPLALEKVNGGSRDSGLLSSSYQYYNNGMTGTVSGLRSLNDNNYGSSSTNANYKSTSFIDAMRSLDLEAALRRPLDLKSGSGKDIWKWTSS